MRTLEGPGFRVAVEDTDPFRDCYHRPIAARLTEAEFGRWQRDFREAWTEIERNHGAYATALAAGLTVLMPLAATHDGRDVSGTARNAFGAVAMAPAADPVTLARLLIHEFQQVKMGAILDLYDLHDRGDDRLFPVPWGEGKLHSRGSCGVHMRTWRLVNSGGYASSPPTLPWSRWPTVPAMARRHRRGYRDSPGFGLAHTARDLVGP